MEIYERLTTHIELHRETPLARLTPLRIVMAFLPGAGITTDSAYAVVAHHQFTARRHLLPVRKAIDCQLALLNFSQVDATLHVRGGISIPQRRLPAQSLELFPVRLTPGTEFTVEDTYNNPPFELGTIRVALDAPETIFTHETPADQWMNQLQRRVFKPEHTQGRIESLVATVATIRDRSRGIEFLTQPLDKSSLRELHIGQATVLLDRSSWPRYFNKNTGIQVHVTRSEGCIDSVVEITSKHTSGKIDSTTQPYSGSGIATITIPQTIEQITITPLGASRPITVTFDGSRTSDYQII